MSLYGNQSEVNIEIVSVLVYEGDNTMAVFSAAYTLFVWSWKLFQSIGTTSAFCLWTKTNFETMVFDKLDFEAFFFFW